MQDKSKCEKKNTTWGCKCKTKASVRRRTLCADANARMKNSKLHEKERLPLLAHKGTNAPT
jgi:hypothetical protein